jgi:hypothetical protein
MNSTELDQIGLSLLVSVRIHEHNELRRQRLGHIFVALAPPWTSHRNGNCTVAPKQIFPRLIVHISHSCQQGQRLSDVLELQLEPVFRRNGQFRGDRGSSAGVSSLRGARSSRAASSSLPSCARKTTSIRIKTTCGSLYPQETTLKTSTKANAHCHARLLTFTLLSASESFAQWQPEFPKTSTW